MDWGTQTYRLGGYREWSAPTDLTRVVEGTWVYVPCPAPSSTPPPGSPPGTVHRVLPHTGVSLVLRATGVGGAFRPISLLLFGPTVTYRFFRPDPDEVLVAVRLKVEWSQAVLGTHPAEVQDLIVPVTRAPAWRPLAHGFLRIRDVASARRSLLALVRDRVGEIVSASAAYAANRALEQIRRAPATARIGCIAREEAMSERTLRRVLGTATGLRPKQIHRIERLNQAVLTSDEVERPSWTGVAYRFGFSDQAHLIREVREWSGCPPVELHAERRAQTAQPTGSVPEAQGPGASHM